MPTQTSIDFNKTGYSYATSKPALESNKEGKETNLQRVWAAILNGACCLLEVCEVTGLPDKSVTGRISDLAKEGKIIYNSDNLIKYKNYNRKLIIVK